MAQIPEIAPYVHKIRQANGQQAILEVAVVPVDDEEADADSRALLYRDSWPY